MERFGARAADAQDDWRRRAKRYGRQIGPALAMMAVLLALVLVGNYVAHWHLHWKAWTTVGVALVALGAMMSQILSPGIAMLCATCAFIVVAPGNPILSVTDALAGFDTDTVGTIAVMFPIAAALYTTGALDAIFRPILGRSSNLFVSLARMTVPCCAVSAFTNNTPLVAMLAPLVRSWAHTIRIPPSRLLLPMNYAVVLGGTITIIGCSTNLTVQTFANQKGLTFNIFELALAGLPNAAAGALWLVLTSKWIMPVRETASDDLENRPREYVVAARVGRSLDGRTIDEARLRNLMAVFLFEVQRDGDVFAAPDGAFRLRAGDLALFAGQIDAVRDVFATDGLVPTELDQALKVGGRRRLFEVAVAAHSPLVGHTVRESQFRSRHNAAIVAVHRAGTRVRGGIGDLELRCADTLLIEAAPAFSRTGEAMVDFALVSEVGDPVAPTPPRVLHAILSVVFLVAAIIAAALNFVPLFGAVLTCLLLMLLTRCLTVVEAWRSMQWDLLLATGCAIAIGAAATESGLAAPIAATLVSLSHHVGHLGTLFLLYLVTALLSSTISNKAAVAVVFPIAYGFIESGFFGAKETVFLIMLAASADWMNAVGYLSNLIVLSAGGYKPVDFIRAGAGLQVVTCVVSVLACWGIWG